mmetsp:Transcript_24036/g.56708  ORF Transcript_24036/g.56708 Transcript_24036/m.56708 type:complete len:80 (-) Transcript_24036:294-533(-)
MAQGHRKLCYDSTFFITHSDEQQVGLFHALLSSRPRWVAKKTGADWIRLDQIGSDPKGISIQTIQFVSFVPNRSRSSGT